MWMLKTGSRRRPVHRVYRNQKPDRLLCPVFRSGRHDSNMRPQHPKCRALPTALRPDNERHYIEQNVSPQNICLLNLQGRRFFFFFSRRDASLAAGISKPTIEQNVASQNICLLNLLGRGFFLLFRKRLFKVSWPIQAHDRAECGIAKHLSPESTGKGIFSSPREVTFSLCKCQHYLFAT